MLHIKQYKIYFTIRCFSTNFKYTRTFKTLNETRTPPVLRSRVFDTSIHSSDDTENPTQKCTAIVLAVRQAAKNAASDKEWETLCRRIQALRPHLLPPHIAAIMKSFADAQYINKELIHSFTKSLAKFTDVRSYISSITSLQRLQYPTEDTIKNFVTRIEHNLTLYTFEDLRYILIAAATIFDTRRRLPTTPASRQFFSSTKICYLCETLYSRVRDSEIRIVLSKLPRSKENPKRNKCNRHRKTVPLLTQGMIGLDSRDFFAIPFALAQLHVYHISLLTQCIKRIRSYVAARLDARPVDVLLAAEGFFFWEVQCQKNGRLENCAYDRIHCAIPLEKLPPAIEYVLRGKVINHSSSIETAATREAYEHIGNRCLTFVQFLLQNASTEDLIDIGFEMVARQIQNVKIWNFWSKYFEENKCQRLNELSPSQLRVIASMWKKFGKPIGQIQYRLLQALEPLYADPEQIAS